MRTAIVTPQDGKVSLPLPQEYKKKKTVVVTFSFSLPETQKNKKTKDDAITPELLELLKEAEADCKAGRVSEPMNAQEAYQHFLSL
jgi:hypothetical protein